MPRRVLITGATGTVSRAVLAASRDADLDVRALVRDPAQVATLAHEHVPAVVGDLGDPATLPAALADVEDLWLLVPNGPRAPEHSSNAVWAARQAGVQRVVRLSVFGAAAGASARSARLHALADAELQRSGLRWTVLRPCWFMQNLLLDAPAVAADRTLRANAGTGRLGMVDVRDVAEVAAEVLRDDSGRHDGATYTLTGPRAVSLADAAALLSTHLGAPVDYLPISDQAQRDTLLSYGAEGWIADMVTEYGAAYADGWGDRVSPDVQEVLGRPPCDLATFVRDHATAFA